MTTKAYLGWFLKACNITQILGVLFFSPLGGVIVTGCSSSRQYLGHEHIQPKARWKNIATFALPCVFPVHSLVCFGCVCTWMHQWGFPWHQERQYQALTDNELLLGALCSSYTKYFLTNTLNVKNYQQFTIIYNNLSTKVKPTLWFICSPFSCMTLVLVF